MSFERVGKSEGTKRRTNALLLMEVLSFDNTETVELAMARLYCIRYCEMIEYDPRSPIRVIDP